MGAAVLRRAGRVPERGASVESVDSIDKAIKWWNNRAIDRDELLKVADECDEADVDGVSDWADRIRKAVGK